MPLDGGNGKAFADESDEITSLRMAGGIDRFGTVPFFIACFMPFGGGGQECIPIMYPNF